MLLRCSGRQGRRRIAGVSTDLLHPSHATCKQQFSGLNPPQMVVLPRVGITQGHAVQGVGVYACCPGYCVTDMTSGGGNKTAREGADTPVWLALQPLGSIPQGGFFGERQTIEWGA